MVKKTNALIYITTCVLILSTVAGTILSAKKSSELFAGIIEDSEYSHNVFIGVAFTQGCGNCHPWNKNIYDAYISGDYDFHYSAMIIYDAEGKVLIQKAQDWEKTYGITSYPTSIFDGDFFRIVGNYPELLPNALNSSGNRTTANITANITASWIGNASMNVTISIKNNEISRYNGYFRTFITEIISRYNTSKGDPFHFGFLDFAFDENISIDAGEAYTNSTIWNGNEHGDEHGNTFGDIVPHNIQLTMVVYNNESGYVDDTVIALLPNFPPYEPNNPYPSNESTGVDLNIDLSWIGGDPDLDPTTYDIYFGNNSPPPKIVNNHSKTTYDPGMLDTNSTYYWQIISWDNYNASTTGPIWHFSTRINNPPEIPEKPSGPNNGTTGFEYVFKSYSTDPNNDQLFYQWDWGDGNYSEWLGPYSSGLNITSNYIWTLGGNYSIRIKAKDNYGSESDWSKPKTIHILAPNIEIDEINGGLFNIKAVIKNSGDGEAINIKWNINLTDGLILLGHQTYNTIQSIPPDEQVNITSRLIFGFGKTNVMINAKASNGQLHSKDRNALVFLFFIII